MEFTELIHAKINGLWWSPTSKKLYLKNESEWTVIFDDFLLCLVACVTYLVIVIVYYPLLLIAHDGSLPR